MQICIHVGVSGVYWAPWSDWYAMMESGCALWWKQVKSHKGTDAVFANYGLKQVWLKHIKFYLIQLSTVGTKQSPEWLTWAQPCQVPMPQSHLGGKAFPGWCQRDDKALLRSERKCWRCVKKVSTVASPHLMFMAWRLLTYRDCSYQD